MATGEELIPDLRFAKTCVTAHLVIDVAQLILEAFREPKTLGFDLVEAGPGVESLALGIHRDENNQGPHEGYGQAEHRQTQPDADIDLHRRFSPNLRT